MGNQEVKKILFTEQPELPLLGNQARELEGQTEDFLHGLYEEASSPIARAIKPDATHSDELDRLVYEPIARVSVLWLMSALRSRQGQAINTEEWVETTMDMLDLSSFRQMSTLQSESEARTAINETAKAIIGSSLIRGQVTVLYESKLGQLEVV